MFFPDSRIKKARASLQVDPTSLKKKSSEIRSRSVSGNNYFAHEYSRARDDNPTAEASPRGNPNRERLRSVSRPPTARVSLDRDINETRTAEPKGRFPASFEPPADPRLQPPSKVRTSHSNRVKGTLKKSSSPIRPSSAASLIAKPPTLASASDSQTRPPFRLSSFSNFSYNPLNKTPTPTKNSPVKPSPTLVSQTSTMSGKASGKAKARDATAVYDLGVTGTAEKNKKSVPVNGSAPKKANESSDEGSSSSDEESSESSSDSSDEESTASDDESASPEKSIASAAGNKNAATAPASDSSESESDSSDESDDDTPNQKAETPSAEAPATNGAVESSSEEEESESETENGGAKVAPAKEIPNSSTESSSEGEEDSDEEMDDASPSSQVSSNAPKTSSIALKAQRAPEPAPSVIDGGFKLQKAQTLGEMAGLLKEADAKGDQVWLLTHPSSTPLNLEVQKVFTSSENHRNSIVPNGTKLTYPISSEGNNLHTISGCASITVTQTMRNDADISSLAQVMSDVRQAKEAPQQPPGLRTRYLPIGVGRASPTLEDSPGPAQSHAPEKPKKDRKKKKDKKEDVSSSQPEPSSERPSKKRKVSPTDEAESETMKGKSKAPASSQPAASSQAVPDSEKPKRSKKSKAQEVQGEAPEDTSAKAKKQKVKFATDETPRTSTPIPPPSVPSSQPADTPSRKSKKKRKLSNEGEASSEKSEKKTEKKGKKESGWSRPEEVRVTPVAPPTVPGMH